MNITKQQLKQIIHEESQTVLKEFEPKRTDQGLSPVELAQRKAKQTQMKAAHAKKAAKLGDPRRPKRQRQDPPVSNYRDPEEARAHQRAKGAAAANLEDIEMYDAPVQGAETSRDKTRDVARRKKIDSDLAKAKSAGDWHSVIKHALAPTPMPGHGKAALETRPGPAHEPPDEGDIGATTRALGAGQKEIDKFKRAKRTRQFEVKFTKQQLEQLIKEELQLFLGEDMAAGGTQP
jgi:hypothetical protein